MMKQYRSSWNTKKQPYRKWTEAANSPSCVYQKSFHQSCPFARHYKLCAQRMLLSSFATCHFFPHHQLQHSASFSIPSTAIPSSYVHSFIFPLNYCTHVLFLYLSKITFISVPVLISSSLMASMWPLLMLFMISMSIPSLLLAVSTSLADEPQFPTSTISAAPALLPDSPLASPPALSPDITPLFPSPGGSVLSPSESSLPTIPSSPSPPNPDAIGAPGPVLAFSPFGSLPLSSSHPLQVSGFLSAAIVSAVFASCW